MRKIFTLNLLLFITALSSSQEQKSDSTKVENLGEVIITGQYSKQSVKKSVFEVKVLTRTDIENHGASDLAHLLNTTLNINIIPNASTGKSGVSLFGLDEQYFKVLIDGIPVINEEGFGNNTDLTLINLNDVERIEIVEGAMGVQYGANSVSGIINVITKKSSRNDWDIYAYIQEETVNDEYEWFDKGRHIQSVKIEHNITENLYGNVSYTRNDFGGYWGDRKGENYDKSDELRGHEWLPKKQHFANLLLSYDASKINLFYKFEYTNETIDKYSKNVDLNENPATGTTNPTALDEIYTNNRFYHHLNGNGLIKNKINYDVSLSYQKQTKDLEQYTYRIREKEKLNIQKGEYLSRSAFFSRGTVSNLFKTKKFSLQTGYEITNEKGFGSPIAITIDPEEENIKQRLDNYDLFASSEFEINDKFSFRPGLRVSFSNLFDNQYIYSLSAKYLFKKEIELRGILGSANRTPNYDELYTYFVDVNHNVQGNPDLTPEKGVSAFLHIKKKSYFNDANIVLKNKVSFSYLDLKDRIELIVVSDIPLAFQYNNIDSFKSMGMFSENAVLYKNLQGKFGIGLLGVLKILNDEVDANDDFLFNLQLNADLSYKIPKWNAFFSVYFKYLGEQNQFVEKTNNEGEQVFVKGTTDAYSWMDATVKKTFLSNKLELMLGVRNLLDLTTVNTTAISGGAHNGPPVGFLLGYGRSYFIKVAYSLKN